MKSGDTGTYHLYGLSNEEVAGSAVGNLAPTDIAASLATLNASLDASNVNYDVYVYYGTTDGGTNAGSWATNAFVGAWTNVSTNVSFAVSSLAPGTTNYYTFMASNNAGVVWASPSWQFATLGSPVSTCLITASAGTGGSITPSGNVMVILSNDQAFAISPNTGYHIADVLVDGGAIGATNSHTFINVMTNHTIAASFAVNQYTVIFNEGSNGSRTGGGALTQLVDYGSAAAVPTIMADTGYVFTGWNSMAFTNVTGNMTVTAQYALDTNYTLSYLAGPHGSISGTATQVVPAGSNGTPVAAVADAGYDFVNWSDSSIANPRTDTSVGSDITVTANFAVDQVIVSNESAAAVSETSADISGELTGGTAANAWICWGLTDGGTSSTGDWANVLSVGAVAESVPFTNQVSGLAGNTTYFFRLYAESPSSSDWSDTATSFSGTPIQGSSDGGGTVTNYFLNGTNYCAHIFTNNGTFHMNESRSIEVLVVGGGGGAGNNGGGGGGAGGCIYSNAYPVLAGSNYVVTIGGGGDVATSGGGSSFGTLTAIGGGGGGSRDSGTGGLNGGSGGGGGGGNAPRINPGTGTPGQGNGGGTGYNNVGSSAGGGGGGATSAGTAGVSKQGGNGGNGFWCDISGVYTGYCGGGAGSGLDYSNYGGKSGTVQAGAGGGGPQNGSRNGRANSGGGGGGIGDGTNSGDSGSGLGGSGIVIVRYPASIAIANLEPTTITDAAATLNGQVNATGTYCAVYVYYGTTDGGTNAGSWATNAFVGSWTNISTSASKTVNLVSGTTNYYTFMASNATKTVWAAPSWKFATQPSSGAVTTNHSVPHAWLASINSSWSNDYEAAAAADPDGDGFSTWEEYWSGTSPTNGNSHLRIDALLFDGTNATIKWQHAQVNAGIPDIMIQAATNLIAGPWTTVGTKTPVNGTNTLLYMPASSPVYFRLVVPDVP